MEQVRPRGSGGMRSTSSGHNHRIACGETAAGHWLFAQDLRVAGKLLPPIRPAPRPVPPRVQAFQRILTEIYHIVSKKALASEDGPAAVRRQRGNIDKTGGMMQAGCAMTALGLWVALGHVLPLCRRAWRSAKL